MELNRSSTDRSRLNVEAAEKIAKMVPGLWEAVYPRSYDSLGNFHSPKIAAAALASAVMSVLRYGADNGGSCRNLFSVACQLDAFEVPTFFVKAALVKAVSETNLADDMDWTDLKMPFPGMLFVFEKGSVIHPEDGEVAFAAVARTKSGDKLSHRMKGMPTAHVRGGGMTLYTAMPETVEFAQYDLSMSEITSPKIKDVIGVEAFESGANEDIRLTISADASRFNQWLMVFCIKLVMVMVARPDLLTKGVRDRIIKPKKGKGNGKPKEFWTPNILGNHYQIQRESGEGGEKKEHQGGTKRFHRRRGHLAKQPYGPGRELRKEIWREPVWVGHL